MNKAQKELLIRLLCKSDKFAELVTEALFDNKAVNKEFDEDEQEKYWEKFVEDSESTKEGMEELVIALFESQRKVMLEKMGEDDSSIIRDAAMIAIWLFSFGLIWETPTQASFIPLMLNGAVNGGKFAANEFNINLPSSFNHQHPELSNTIRTHSKLFAATIVSTTVQALQDALKQGIDGGESMGELKSRVNSVFDDAVKNRSKLIAVNESIWASNAGILFAYQKSGIVGSKVWYASIDERTCKFCLDMYKKYGPGTSGIPLNENFLNANIPHPPLHPNCRCVILPKMKR